MEEKFTLGVIVSNHFGVLNRVAGLFSKRCYNINSLTVGETEDERFSRMTITATGDDYVKEQMVKQLNKLYDVKNVMVLDDKAVIREHMLIKLRATHCTKPKISEMIKEYDCRVVSLSSDSITVELSETTDVINTFLQEATGIGILELCRSGAISLVHGSEQALTGKDLKKEYESYGYNVL